MTKTSKFDERSEVINKIVKLLNNLTDNDIAYCLTIAETLATRALINQETSV